MREEMRLGRACRAALDAEHANQAFREGKTAWDAQDRDAGRAQWATKIVGKQSGDNFTKGCANRWPGRHETSSLGRQQGCSETKIASGGDDLRAERTVFANILSYIAISIHNVSQD